MQKRSHDSYKNVPKIKEELEKQSTNQIIYLIYFFQAKEKYTDQACKNACDQNSNISYITVSLLVEVHPRMIFFYT